VTPEEVNADVGARIRFERRARDWSVTDLAERTGISAAQLTNIERRPGSARGGKQITVVEVLTIAAAFGVHPGALLGHVETTPEAGPWRVGQHYRVHVYEVTEGDGQDRVVATFLRPEDAAAAVDAFNRAALSDGGSAVQEPAPGNLCHGMGPGRRPAWRGF
jgi:transcriptional regulator with XRE-family HTH domain